MALQKVTSRAKRAALLKRLTSFRKTLFKSRHQPRETRGPIETSLTIPLLCYILGSHQPRETRGPIETLMTRSAAICRKNGHQPRETRGPIETRHS